MMYTKQDAALILVVLFLLVSTGFPQKSLNTAWTCAPGWQNRPKSHKCYKVFSFSNAWKVGLTYCSIFDGRLALIDSLDTQDYLANLLTEFLQASSALQQSSSILTWVGLVYMNRKFQWAMNKQTIDNYKANFYTSAVKPPNVFGPQSEGADIYRWAKNEPSANECGALYALNNASESYDDLYAMGWHGNLFSVSCSNTPPAAAAVRARHMRSRRVSAIICETQQQRQQKSAGQTKIEGDLVSPDTKQSGTEVPNPDDVETYLASVAGNPDEFSAPEWSAATQYWQNGRIPYVFDTEFSVAERRQLVALMQLIMKTSECIRFIPRASEPDYLKFNRTDNLRTCAAKGVGWVGGEQNIIIGLTCFNQSNLIVHELLHVLGMPHEHQRPDRDNFVTINADVIEFHARSQFLKFNETLRTWFGYDYDFESITHYPPDAFSKMSGLIDTIEVNFPTRSSKWKEAHTKLQRAQTKLSELDRVKLNALYCAPKSSPKSAHLLLPVKVPEKHEPNINSNDLRPSNNASSTEDDLVLPKMPCGYWTHGIVPYAFDSKFNATEIGHAEDYFAQLMADFCGITFRRKRPADTDYVLFTRSNIPNLCFAQGAGKCGGAQRVFLDSACVMDQDFKGRFLHEMLHVLGLPHEFQRPDRDTYVIVDENNVSRRDRPNYAKYSIWLPGWDAKSPYDFDSVLHYEDNPNVRVRPEWNYASSLLGTRTELSAGDKMKLKRLYRCNL